MVHLLAASGRGMGWRAASPTIAVRAGIRMVTGYIRPGNTLISAQERCVRCVFRFWLVVSGPRLRSPTRAFFLCTVRLRGWLYSYFGCTMTGSNTPDSGSRETVAFSPSSVHLARTSQLSPLDASHPQTAQTSLSHDSQGLGRLLPGPLGGSQRPAARAVRSNDCW